MNAENVTDDPTPAEIKQALRITTRQKRRSLSEAARQEKSEKITQNFLKAVPLIPQSVISAYWPIRTEVNTEHLIERLIALGHIISLPVMDEAEDRLIFRRFRLGDHLLPGPFRLPQPLDTAEQVQPHVIIVPMLGFTRDGHRLGYGKGYYDKTLNKKRREKPITAIGVAFGIQEIVDIMPVEPHDEPLDWIVTENEVIKIAQ